VVVHEDAFIDDGLNLLFEIQGRSVLNLAMSPAHHQLVAERDPGARLLRVRLAVESVLARPFRAFEARVIGIERSSPEEAAIDQDVVPGPGLEAAPGVELDRIAADMEISVLRMVGLSGRPVMPWASF
jgi:hypothetical protein